MFEIIMQHNPQSEEPLNLNTINQLISFVWEDFTLGNYNFFVLSHKEKPSYLQFHINEEADFILELLKDERVYRLTLDDLDTLKLIFKGYYNDFPIDVSAFEDVTDSIRKDQL